MGLFTWRGRAAARLLAKEALFAGYRLAVRGGLVPDRHIEHCRWAEQRAMAHQDERWGGLAMQYGGYGGLFMG